LILGEKKQGKYYFSGKVLLGKKRELAKLIQNLSKQNKNNLNFNMILIPCSIYMKILVFDNDIDINEINELYTTVNLVLSEPMFISNLSNNYNWTNTNIDTTGINDTILYIFSL